MSDAQLPLQDLRARHLRERSDILATLIPPLDWPAPQLAADRTNRLRKLIAHAKTHSSWHRERLRQIDPNTVTEADLERIPPMTKTDLVSDFDGIVTDPKLTLERVLSHLRAPIDNPYLDGRYIATNTGGTTGTPSIFVYDRHAFSTLNCLILRWRLRNMKFDSSRRVAGNSVSLYADQGTHLSQMSSRVFPPLGNAFKVPVTRPLPWIVEQLNAIQPVVMTGYSSILSILAEEAAAGRLAIAPREILSTGEVLTAEMRQTLIRQWPVSVLNIWGMTEGLFAVPCHAQDHQHLPDDLAIVEPLDRKGNRAIDCVSDSVLLTNLYNVALPLIRLEISDQIAISDEPCPCGSQHKRVVAIEGRAEDRFSYLNGRIQIVGAVLRVPLQRIRHIVAFQVHQTTNGIHVLLVENGPVDHGSVVTILREALSGCGLEIPTVTIETVENISRTPVGKHREFISMK